MSNASHAGTPPPWPSEWPTRRPKVRALLTDGFLGLLTLLSLGLGALAWSSGEPGPALFLLAGGVFLGTITALSVSMWSVRRRVSPRSVGLHVTGSDHDGVAIAYSARLHHGMAAILLMASIALSVYTAAGVLGWVVPPFLVPRGITATTAFGVGAALCTWLFIEFASGRIARGRLVLTPDGIYHRAHTFEHFAPWQTVRSVSAVESSGNPLIVATASPSDGTRTRRTWFGQQQEFTALPDVVVRGRSLAADPAVAYHALRYYHAHPESRSELLTSAGERRIWSGDLLD